VAESDILNMAQILEKTQNVSSDNTNTTNTTDTTNNSICNGMTDINTSESTNENTGILIIIYTSSYSFRVNYEIPLKCI